MSKLVTLKRFLLDHPHFAIEQKSIVHGNARAAKAGKPLPHPYVRTYGSGFPALVDPDDAREWAASKGKSHFFEGRKGR